MGLALARASLRLRLHVEFVDDDFEDVEILDLKVAEELLVRLICRIQICPGLGGHRPAQLLVNLVQEAIPTVLQLDDLLGLELLNVILVARLLERMVALVHHVRVIHAGRANHAHLVLLFLLLQHLIGALAVAQQHLHLVLLVLLKLCQLLLLGLHEYLLEDELVLLLALGGECPIRALRFLLVREAHGVRGGTCCTCFRLLSLLEQRFVDRVDSLLLLLVLGDLLRPNNAVQLVYLVHVSRLLVV